MSLIAIEADRKAGNEQKLNDLTSKADFLAEACGTRPMTWHEFQQAYQGDPPRKWSNTSTLLGGIGGAVVFTLGLTVLGEPGAVSFPTTLLAGLGGAGVGAVIGKQFPMEADKRAAQIEAYERYLNDFAAKGHAPERGAHMAMEMPPPVPGRIPGQAVRTGARQHFT